MSEIIVLITASSGKEARKVARHLVAKRYAACVNILDGIKSVFTWKGKTQVAGESLLIIKTKKGLFSGLEKEVRRIHSYECPEIIALPIIKGSPDYLKWVRMSTR